MAKTKSSAEQKEETRASESPAQTVQYATVKYRAEASSKTSGKTIHRRRQSPPVPEGDCVADKTPSPPAKIKKSGSP